MSGAFVGKEPGKKADKRLLNTPRGWKLKEYERAQQQESSKVVKDLESSSGQW